MLVSTIGFSKLTERHIAGVLASIHPPSKPVCIGDFKATQAGTAH